MSGAMWSLVTILGPILLIAAIVWAFLRNRGARPGSFERAERGAEELRDELERDPQYRDE